VRADGQTDGLTGGRAGRRAGAQEGRRTDRQMARWIERMFERHSTPLVSGACDALGQPSASRLGSRQVASNVGRVKLDSGHALPCACCGFLHPRPQCKLWTSERHVAPPHNSTCLLVHVQAAYKQELGEAFGITFNSLFALNNMPIKRFVDYLHARDKLDEYMELLVGSFNAAAAEVMLHPHSKSASVLGGSASHQNHHH
jgi:Protein of unknown function (DUF3641)